MIIAVIAEKNSVAERIAYFLSGGKPKRVNKKGVYYFTFNNDKDEYFVIGLKGHIVELDYPEKYKNWVKDDLKELINIEPVKIEKFKNLINILKEIISKADEVIIATDYDREGELIGREAVEILNYRGKLKRAKFSAVTKDEIMNAFRNLTELNNNLADAAESRQNIDLVWGAVLTRFFSLVTGQKWKNFISVGRVQSPTLALIVDREKKIKNFKPEKYWQLIANFIEKNVEFVGEHEKNPFKERPDNIFNKIKDFKKGEVLELKEREYEIRPPPPFNTTEFLRESTKLGLSVGRTMSIAEDLYSKGYISYPRTDNTVYPPSINLKSLLEKFLNSQYKEEAKELLSQEKIRASRGKVQTTDHPPIYPVKAIKENELKGDYFKVYDLVVKRFFATIAPDSKIKSTDVKISINDEIFNAKGTKVLDEGWMKYYPYLRIREKEIPDLGKEVNIKSIELLEKETKPPERYNQASLIKEMENLNLGTKSTRHEIIEKLYERNYIEGMVIKPTSLGISLVEAMERNNVDAVKPDMTAKLEQDMSAIEEGKMEKAKVIEESKAMLSNVLNELEKNEDNIKKIINTGINEDREMGKCPKCGSPLLMYKNKNFRYIQCSRYPECDFRYYLPKTGKIELTDKQCPVCGLPLIKIIRKGQEVDIKCINPKCEYNKKKETIGECPEDGGELVIRQSKAGKRFIGCSNYPKCKITYPLPQKGEIIPTFEKCPYCGLPLIIVKNGKYEKKQCIDPKCKYNKKGIG
ncbi:MAG: DNA topoisomerase I [Thermoplasmata archaeon]|nr:DNA topoisomerase I [Thermoplasmata archaeon]